MKVDTIKSVTVQAFNKLVTETYGRVYHFQQQNDCLPRGFYKITVPATPEDYENESVPEVVNHPTMGVKFESWLKRDPNQYLIGEDYEVYDDNWKVRHLRLWWERNFYPHVSMVINDLYSKGLLEAGEYHINVDW